MSFSFDCWPSVLVEADGDRRLVFLKEDPAGWLLEFDDNVVVVAAPETAQIAALLNELSHLFGLGFNMALDAVTGEYRPLVPDGVVVALWAPARRVWGYKRGPSKLTATARRATYVYDVSTDEVQQSHAVVDGATITALYPELAGVLNTQDFVEVTIVTKGNQRLTVQKEVTGEQ